MSATTPKFQIPPELIPDDVKGGHVVRKGEGRTLHYAGNLMQWKLEEDHSHGFCSVVEIVMRRDEEPPLHVHEREEEMYFLQEGEVTFYVGSDVIEAKPGDAVLLPRRVPHAFSVSKASETARLVLLVWPSNSLAGYFDTMGREATGSAMAPPEPDFPVEKAVEAIAPHGVTLLGPGPSLVEDGLA